MLEVRMLKTYIIVEERFFHRFKFVVYYGLMWLIIFYRWRLGIIAAAAPGPLLALRFFRFKKVK